MRAVAVIQARMGSARLPGKVMLPIGGKTMLDRVCDQVARIKSLDDWVVAVPESDAACVRAPHRWLGPSVPLARYAAAAEHFKADIIMRITADCPLLDAEVATAILAEFRLSSGRGYLSNVRPRRLHPDGCDVEVFTREMLDHQVPHAGPEEWEHVTAGMPAWFFPALEPMGVDLRWTVDTEADLEFVREVYRGLGDRPVSIANVLSVVPGDACEHCAAKAPHLERLDGDGKMTTNWALHQVPVEQGMRLPGGWSNYPAWARTTGDGRIFVACEAWEMARWGGTRRKS